MTFVTLSAQAQIIPDATLPVNSTVRQQGNTSVIEGGTSAGTNLFHSFREFSIPTNGTAFFNNAAGIQNILTRVTGGSISNIDGLIQANGTTNLFLINPNGIIFGANAALNIGGSFLASTASQINFADGTQFSATSPQTTPLLTVSVPVGLQFGTNSSNTEASIFVQGAGNNLSYNPDTFATIRDNRPIGLAVPINQTLALVGGDINLVGGNLTAPFGRIELGSVALGCSVSLTPTNQGWHLAYEGVQNFQDISLSQAASVDTSGSGGGSIQVQGRRVTLADGSAILSFTEGSNLGGNITIRASQLVEIIGSPTNTHMTSQLATNIEPKAVGNGGKLRVETRLLTLRDGAQISASTFGQGKAGDVLIKATDAVELIGRSSNGVFGTLFTASAEKGSTGDGGSLDIETRRLTLKDGAQIGTVTFEQGNAGDVLIKATDAVELSGTSSYGQYPSGLGTTALPNSTGNAGNLTIFTRRLTLKDGAQIITGTFGQGNAGELFIKATDTIELIGTSAIEEFRTGFGVSANPGATGNAGNLTIETRQLTIKNGAAITTSTSGQGKAGDIAIKATDTIELIGTSAIKEFPSILSASANPGSTGDAGNLTIETRRLSVKDGAMLRVQSRAEGKAGTLRVFADSIELSSKASLNANTTSSGGSIQLQAPTMILRASNITTNATRGESGGNITLSSQFLQLRDGSTITTNAISSEVKGGNININTGILAALENSDISANSQQAQGGRVTINAQAIFGSQSRTREQLERLLNTSDPALLVPARLPSSDITATGANPSLSGTVAINTPDLDPSAGVVKLPENPVDATRLITSTCRRGKQQSEFNITGRGGLPPNPYEAIAEEATWIDLRPAAGERANSGTEQQIRIASHTEELTVTIPQLIEAQGWIINSQGQLELVAHVPAVSPQTPRFIPQPCHEQ